MSSSNYEYSEQFETQESSTAQQEDRAGAPQQESASGSNNDSSEGQKGGDSTQEPSEAPAPESQAAKEEPAPTEEDRKRETEPQGESKVSESKPKKSKESDKPKKGTSGDEPTSSSQQKEEGAESSKQEKKQSSRGATKKEPSEGKSETKSQGHEDSPHRSEGGNQSNRSKRKKRVPVPEPPLILGLGTVGLGQLMAERPDLFPSPPTNRSYGSVNSSRHVPKPPSKPLALSEEEKEAEIQRLRQKQEDERNQLIRQQIIEEKNRAIILQQNKLEHERQLAEENARERRELRARLMEERETEVAKLRAIIQRDRKHDRTRRVTVLNDFEAKRVGEIANEKQTELSEQEKLRQEVEEEKARMREHVAWIRQCRLEEQRQAREAQEEERKARLRQVQEQKEQLKSKLDNWRQEKNSLKQVQMEATQHFRRLVDESVKRSVAGHHEHQRQLVNETRKEFQRTKSTVVERRDAMAQELHKEVAERKKEQESQFHLVLEKIHRNRAKNAAVIRSHTARNREAVLAERAEHVAAATARKTEVQQQSARKSPTAT